MFRRQVAALGLAVLLTPLAFGQANVVGLIPADAFGYVAIQRIGRVDEKLQALGRQMQLPIPSLLMMAQAQSGLAKGLDKSGSLIVAILPSSTGPVALGYLPVDDYAAFIDQLDPQGTDDEIVSARLLGRPVIIGHREGHAVIARPEQRSVLEKALSVGPAARPGSLRTLDGEHDVVAVLSPAGVRLLSSLVRQGLQQVKAGLRAQLGDENPAMAGLELYDRLLAALDSEVDSVAVGLQLETGGPLRVSKTVWAQANGKLAALLRNAQPHQGDLLWGLPDIPYVAAFGGLLPAGAWEPLLDVSKSMMKSMPQIYGLTAEQIDKMIELSAKYFTDMRGMSLLVGVNKGDAPLYSAMVGVLKVGNAETYLQNYRKYWQELDQLVGDAEQAFFKDVEIDDVNVGGVSMLKLRMPIPGMTALQLPNPNAIDALMEKIYGPDGLTIYLAAADQETVLMGYTEPTLLQATLQTVKTPSQQLSNDQQLGLTSKLLPSGAQAVGYWSPSGTVEFVNRMIELFAETEAEMRLPAFPETPPVGWSLRAAPQALKVEAVFPAELLGAVGGFVERVQRFAAQRN